jgi:hypothetical protein
VSTVESLPAYDDYSSPRAEQARIFTQQHSDSPTSPGSGWHSRLVLSTSGLSIAMSEESLRSLKYCLSWLKWASDHIGKAIDALKMVLEEFEGGDKTDSNGALTSDDNTNGTSNRQLMLRSNADRIAMHAKIAELKSDVPKTLKNVVDVVSKYAGGALPENARMLVRRHLTSLPQRFRLASTSRGQNGQPTQTGDGEVAEGARKVMVLAKEGLDMMAQVSGVLDGTIVSAEEWNKRLGRKKRSEAEGEDTLVRFKSTSTNSVPMPSQIASSDPPMDNMNQMHSSQPYIVEEEGVFNQIPGARDFEQHQVPPRYSSSSSPLRHPIPPLGPSGNQSNAQQRSMEVLKSRTDSLMEHKSESSETVAATDDSVNEDTPVESSEIETDWEEGESERDKIYHEICVSNLGKQLSNSNVKRRRAERLLGEAHKQKLIDHLMREFYIIIERMGTSYRTCTGSHGSSSQSSARVAESSTDQTSTKTTGMKRRIEGDDGIPGEDDDNRPPKHFQLSPNPCEERSLGTKFACPYHQHNPIKYGVNLQTNDIDYRSCAGPGWKSVARIK